MNKLFPALALLVAFLMPSFASAQSFGNHYDQTTVNFTAGQISPAYLSIPRQGWPVRVQVSAIDPPTGSVQGVASFTIVDGVEGNPSMTVPPSIALQQAVTCGSGLIDTDVYAGAECFIGGTGLSVGYVDGSSLSHLHQMFIRVSNCNCALQVRVTMWY